jgi:uncharacterized protein (DUF697 family)/putative sterol carrier protein
MSFLDTLDDIRTRDFSKATMKERDKAARDVGNMCSYACAVVALSPIPFSDVVLMFPIQSAMVMTIGHVYGRKVTTADAKDLILELGATAGLGFLARQGIKALIPVVGALVTVPAAFAANWAIGRVAAHYFRDPNATKDSLHDVYEEAKREGSSLFSKDAFDEFRSKKEREIHEVAKQEKAPKAAAAPAGPLTPRAIIEDRIPAALEKKKDLARKINALVHIKIDGPHGGKWTVDLTKQEDWVTKGLFGQPAMTVACSDDDFVKIATGKKDAQMAVLSGALKFDPMDLEMAAMIGQLFT